MLIYQVLTVVSAMITLGLSIYAYKMRKARVALIYSALMLLTTMYTVSSFLELITEGLGEKFFCRKISQTIALLIFPTVLFMVMVFTGRRITRKHFGVFGISLIPISGILIIWADKVRYLVITRTLFGKTIAMANYAILVAAIIMLIMFYKRIKKEYRKQVVGFIAGIVVPMIWTVLKESSPEMAQILPPTAISLTIAGILFFWSISKYRILSIVPVASDKVIESIREGILTVDTLGRIIDKNTAIDGFILDITESNHNILGKSIDDVFSVYPRWLAACKSKQADEFEIDSSAWGKKRYYHVKVYPLDGTSIKSRGTVSIVFDITEDKSRQQDLISTTKQLAELNTFKDKLFSIVAHDIRNPLSTIVSFMELMEEEHNSSENEEIVLEVRKQAENTYSIVEQLLEWFGSQKNGMVCSPLIWDLSQIVQKAVNVLRSNAGAKGIGIINNVEEGINVFADKEMLGLVLRNLLSSAVKFTGNGGTISVQACEFEDRVVVAINDTGEGIDCEKAKTLFSEAYIYSTEGATEEKGTEMGLLICREFIFQNGGEMLVNSTSGKGSTICFSLLSAVKNQSQIKSRV